MQHCALSKSYYIVEWYLGEVLRHNLAVFNYKMLDLLRLRLYTVRVVVSGIGRPPVRCETHLGKGNVLDIAL